MEFDELFLREVYEFLQDILAFISVFDTFREDLFSRIAFP